MTNGFIETIAFTLWSSLVFTIGWAIGRNEKRKVEDKGLPCEIVGIKREGSQVIKDEPITIKWDSKP